MGKAGALAMSAAALFPTVSTARTAETGPFQTLLLRWADFLPLPSLFL